MYAETKIALNKVGSGRTSHEREIQYMVFTSKIALGVEANLELIEILLTYLETG